MLKKTSDMRRGSINHQSDNPGQGAREIEYEGETYDQYTVNTIATKEFVTTKKATSSHGVSKETGGAQPCSKALLSEC